MLGLNSVIAGLEGANTGILDVLESGLKVYENRNKISLERLTFNSKEVSWMENFKRKICYNCLFSSFLYDAFYDVPRCVLMTIIILNSHFFILI